MPQNCSIASCDANALTITAARRIEVRHRGIPLKRAPSTIVAFDPSQACRIDEATRPFGPKPDGRGVEVPAITADVLAASLLAITHDSAALMTPALQAAAILVANWLGRRAHVSSACVPWTDLGLAEPGPAESAWTKRDEILALIAARASCPDLTPDRIARQTGVSRTVLYQKLKSLGGVATVVQRQRLRLMCLALADRDDARRIEAITHDSGFRYPSHASRVFQRTFGMTPGSFRRASRVGQTASADESGR